MGNPFPSLFAVALPHNRAAVFETRPEPDSVADPEQRARQPLGAGPTGKCKTSQVARGLTPPTLAGR